jgi:hypothetical protein
MAWDERSITEANRDAGMGSDSRKIFEIKFFLGGKMMLRQGNQGTIEMRLENGVHVEDIRSKKEGQAEEGQQKHPSVSCKLNG